jgi:hypothetical protein
MGEPAPEVNPYVSLSFDDFEGWFEDKSVRFTQSAKKRPYALVYLDEIPRLKGLPARAILVYTLLRYLVSVTKRNPVPLTTRFAAAHGIPRRDKSRALAALEAANLIRRTRRGQKTVLVTLLGEKLHP